METRKIRTVGSVALLALALGACGDDFMPEYVDEVVIIPGTVFTVVGQDVSVQAEVSGPRGQPYPDRIPRVEWSIADPTVASLEVVDGTITIRGLKLGATRLTAELGRGTGTAQVYVEPEGLDRISINPSPIELGFPGARGVVAELWDANGNRLDPIDYRIQWQVGDESIASLLYRDATPTSVRARGPGQTTLILRVGGLVVSTSIRVN